MVKYITPENVTAVLGILGAILGYFHVVKRRATQAEILSWAQTAIEAVANALNVGDIKLGADGHVIVDEWLARFREFLDDAGITITDSQLAQARAVATKRLTDIAVKFATDELAAAANRMQQLGDSIKSPVPRAAAQMSTPEVMHRVMSTKAPPFSTGGNGKR